MSKLLVALGLVGGLAGCDLYFDGHHGGGRGDKPEPGMTTPPGDACQSNTDCAAGCDCESGTCEETGFCAENSDCGPGYYCDLERSTCEALPPGCSKDADCATGQVCDTSSHACVATSCAVDTTITCQTLAPTCPVGQVPSEANGCFTGSCQATATCATPPSCNFINDEGNCLGRDDCSAAYTGIDCTNAGGTACHTGDSGCTCASFEFATCANRAAN